MPDPGLSIKLYLDADVNMKLAANLRREGFDCISAREVGHDTLGDEDILAFATSEGRSLLTHNIQDFVPIFEQWWFAERSHHGIIVSQHLPIGEIQERILRLLVRVNGEEMGNTIRNLAEFAVRE